MNKAVVLVLSVFCHAYCEGFDFTLFSQSQNPKATSGDRQTCGVLQCTETLLDTSDLISNHSRSLISFTVYKNRSNGGGNNEHWQQLASLTSQQPALKRVADGISVTGQLSDHKAHMLLDLYKAIDCQESQFSCVAVYVDNQGKTSLTTSVVGKAVTTQQDFELQQKTTKSFGTVDGRQPNDQSYSATTLAQVLNLFQSKFDAVAMRLDDSLKALENRLEDKVGNMQTALDNKISNLENRLEDKLVNLHMRVSESMLHTQSQISCRDDTKDRSQSELDNLVNNVTEKLTNSLNTLIERSCKKPDTTASQCAPVIRSVKSLEQNLTFFYENVNKLETNLNQCVMAATREDGKLTNLITAVASLSGLTQSLASNVDTFTDSYAGGALVPVNTLFDPFGVGKKEWKLVFRGTAYNNVQMYPAYVHGTGIPVDVEEGCKQFNRSLPCVNHYRDRLAFDNWVGIDEVLFAVYKDDQMVQSVVFNGKGSTYTSWFSAGRVILSSWDDLITQPHNFFSIEGHVHPAAEHIRRFHINRDYDRGCDGFKGWLTVKDSAGNGCPAENTVSMPLIQYATGKTFSGWTGSNVARADAIGIFLKYE